MADDKLQIPDADRIHNISPLPDNFDPNDDTLLNAEWVMRIFDKIVNGEYATRPFTVYDTLADLPSEDVLAGQTAYVVEEPSHFYLYNGTTWYQMPNITEASGGTSDYTDLTNKPSINGTTLSGNKTGTELGLQNKNLSFTNIAATNWVSDTEYTDFGYKCDLVCVGTTSNTFAQVTFDIPEVMSGNYAPVCDTSTDTVTIYSKVADGITVSSIIVQQA